MTTRKLSAGGFTFSYTPQKVTAKAHYGLTTLGRVKAEEYKFESPKADVVAVLQTEGPSTVNEIAKGANLTPERVTRIIKALIEGGYVQKEHAEG